MGKFDGKKVLFLCGSVTGSVEMVQYMKSENAIVFVADYLPPELSPAKKIADAHFLVSTLDYDAVKKLAIDLSVDAVFCGIHEKTLCIVEKLCKDLGLFCYFNESQWKLIENKAGFKDFCIKNGVSVPCRYKMLDANDIPESIKYPVIVKPTDCSGSVGITVCYNEDELKSAYVLACSSSSSHNAIVEQYIFGQEFSVTYNAINGEVALQCFYERLINKEFGVGISECCFYPTEYLPLYLKKMNDKVIKMIKNLGLVTGTIFFQGLVNDDEEFYLFEAALRLGGPETWKIDNAINGFSSLRLLVDYAILGKTEEKLSNENPFLKNKYCFILKLLTKGGTVSKIEGLEYAISLPGVLDYTLTAEIGKSIEKVDVYPRRSIAARFFVAFNSLNEAIETIKDIYSHVHIYDNNGKYMTSQPEVLYKKLGI